MFNTSCTVPSASNISRILAIVTLLVVVYEIQPSVIVELQQHSQLSNNTSVTTYVHRLIIPSPCFFINHMKEDEHVATLFQCFLFHTQQTFCSYSFCCWEITLQRVYTSIWDTLYLDEWNRSWIQSNKQGWVRRNHGRLDRWRRWSACDAGKSTLQKGWRMRCDVAEATEGALLIL